MSCSFELSMGNVFKNNLGASSRSLSHALFQSIFSEVKCIINGQQMISASILLFNLFCLAPTSQEFSFYIATLKVGLSL